METYAIEQIKQKVPAVDGEDIGTAEDVEKARNALRFTPAQVAVSSQNELGVPGLTKAELTRVDL